MPADTTVHVRYLVDDVAGAIDFYTKHFGFTVRSATLPAFAEVVRGNLRLLLSGPQSSAGFKPNDVIDLTIEPADTSRVASV